MLGLILVDMGTCCILYVMNVAGTRIKRAGIDGFSRGYILGGIINGKNLLNFINLNELADERSGGRLVSWIDSWWKDRTEAAWWGRALKRLLPDDWFDMHIQDRPIVWNPPHNSNVNSDGIIQ